MARRYINTSQFNPYTFQEMWQPAEAATNAHMQQATAFSQLGAQAAFLGDFIDPQKDPEEYAAWREYSSNLKSGAESLMHNGLTTSTYNTLWRSTVDYASKIKPIEFAVENKQKFAQMLNQTSLSHPNALFVKDQNDYTLKDYRSGVPQPELIDMDAVGNEAKTIAAAYANDKLRFENPQQYDRFRQIIRKKYGDTFDEAMANINDPEQRLYQIKQMVMESAGANRLLDNGKTGAYARLERTVDNSIITGAVGKTEANLDDTVFRHNLELAKFAYQRQRDKQAAQDAIIAEDTRLRNNLVWEYAPGNRSRRQYGWAAMSHGKDAEKYQDLFLARLAGRKVTDLKGNTVNLAKKAGKSSEKNSEFGITFEGIRNSGEYNQPRSPYYLVKWNGETYRVTANDLGLDGNTSRIIKYTFGNTVPQRSSFASDDEYNTVMSNRRIVDEYRKNPAYFSKDPQSSAYLDALIESFTLYAQKNLFALATPHTENYKLDE